jgi:general secretion pathway protein G
LPEDPWGNPYQLLSPGELGTLDIFSNGPDREPGTDDDIGNWNLNEYLN